jgi:hypothetical protein
MIRSHARACNPHHVTLTRGARLERRTAVRRLALVALRQRRVDVRVAARRWVGR